MSSNRRADPDAVFGDIAELYDRVRPGYPRQALDDLIEVSGIPAGGRILEIGCGTGIGTRSITGYNRPMLSLDPSPRMIAVARRTCAAYPNVRFQLVSFEDWPLEEGAFHLTVAFQSFHWVRPEVGYAKAARTLAPGGTFALIWNSPRSAGTALDQALDDAYDRLAPDLRTPAPGLGPESSENVKRIDSTGMFGPVEWREYPWQAEYDTDRWVQFLSTSSDHIALPPDRREELLKTVHDLVEQHGGVYRVPVVTLMYLAKRRAR